MPPPGAGLPLVLVRACGRELLHYVADGETRRLGARQEVLEAFDVPRHGDLRGNKHEHPMHEPAGVELTPGPTLKRIGAQVV
jgi:hypothetical protein